VSRPPRAPWAPEHIDLVGHDPRVLADSLRDVEKANDWFGGTRSVRRALAPLMRKGETVSLLDVGTGSAGIVRRLRRWARARGTDMEVTGVDLHPEVLAVALAAGGLPLVRANTLMLPFADRSFDFTTATLLLHHLPDLLQPRALREMARVTRRAVIVAELERSWIHYAGARLLAATIWRSNPLTRHDGPISVMRGYHAGELRRIAADAGLAGSVRRSFFYRLVLVTDGAANAAASSTVRA
jgi:2-polyprenyl-3-methyl-5-hydroxy-6-metoxy-1,4-benzoquinol methylase